MAEFTSLLWPLLIFVIAVFGLLGSAVLLRWMEKGGTPADREAPPVGHTWDGDIYELDYALPRWWVLLYYLTIVFGVGYLVLYPGVGIFKGALGWTQEGQYEREMAIADKAYGPLFEGYRTQDLRVVAEDPRARKIGERLFFTYCTSCHGSDAGGGAGFPNLRDHDWLYGGEPEMIQTSILLGRSGVMPAWGQALGHEGVHAVAEYVMSLSGRRVNPDAVAAGQIRFVQMCAGCHGVDAKGNPALGAPNLTDTVWLYGGSQAAIMKTISEGRQGRMPAHGEFLGEAKVHLLAAYVYGLSRETERQDGGR